jgi:hypothetical protein
VSYWTLCSHSRDYEEYCGITPYSLAELCDVLEENNSSRVLLAAYFAYSATMMIEAELSSETSVYFYQAI